MSNAGRQGAKAGSPCSYHVVVVSSGGEPYLDSFSTVEALAERLRELHGSDCNVFAYEGEPMWITDNPGRRYLVRGEERIPLFEDDDKSEVDPTGYMGV